MIRTRTFQWQTAAIQLREPIGIDLVDEQVIYPKITYNRASERERLRAADFASSVLQTVQIQGDFPFPWVTVDSSAEDMQKAFAAWITWPVDLMGAWRSNLFALQRPATEPALDLSVPEKNSVPPNATADGG